MEFDAFAIELGSLALEFVAFAQDLRMAAEVNTKTTIFSKYNCCNQLFIRQKYSATIAIVLCH